MLRCNQRYWVAKHIRQHWFFSNLGFMPEQVLPDKYNPDYVVWVYRITPEFREALDAWLKHMDTWIYSEKSTPECVQ